MLQRAAAVANKTVTEFMLDASLNATFDTLADCGVFQIDDKLAALSDPPKNNPSLRKLLGRKPVWKA